MSSNLKQLLPDIKQEFPPHKHPLKGTISNKRCRWWLYFKPTYHNPRLPHPECQQLTNYAMITCALCGVKGTTNRARYVRHHMTTCSGAPDHIKRDALREEQELYEARIMTKSAEIINSRRHFENVYDALNSGRAPTPPNQRNNAPNQPPNFSNNDKSIVIIDSFNNDSSIHFNDSSTLSDAFYMGLPCPDQSRMRVRRNQANEANQAVLTFDIKLKRLLQEIEDLCVTDVVIHQSPYNKYEHQSTLQLLEKICEYKELSGKMPKMPSRSRLSGGALTEHLIMMKNRTDDVNIHFYKSCIKRGLLLLEYSAKSYMPIHLYPT